MVGFDCLGISSNTPKNHLCKYWEFLEANFWEEFRGPKPSRPARSVLHCPASLPSAPASQTALRTGQAATAGYHPFRLSQRPARSSIEPAKLSPSRAAGTTEQAGLGAPVFGVLSVFAILELRLSILCSVLSVSFQLCVS